MRNVAGSLRLDLAQFRELAAFAQFGSDLDQATQRQLAKGERLTEVLKQPQYEPLAVEKQVLMIFAANNGYLNEIPTASVLRYERELYEAFEARHADLLKAIVADKKFGKNPESREKMSETTRNVVDAILKFTEEFDVNR
jgi:F-type H+-transporting ATPase subunit alpha